MTTLLLASFCLGLMPLVSASPATVARGEPALKSTEEEIVTRIYDLSSLTWEYAEAQERFFKLAAHLRMSNVTDLSESDGGIDSIRGADEVVNFLVNTLGEEFEYEGREIQTFEEGRMLVRGPEGLQSRVQELLAILDEIVNAQLELTIHVVQLDPSAESPFGGRVVVPRTEVERWLGGITPTVDNQEFRLNLHADQPAELDITRTQPLVADYDVEIAQAATIADPIVTHLTVGTTAYILATPTPQGIALSVVFKRSDLVGEVRERSLRMNGEVRTDSGLVKTSPSSVYQTYDLLGRSYAFDAILKNDQAIVLHNRIDLTRERRNELVILRWTAGDLPWRKMIKLAAPVGDMLAVNLAFLSPPTLRANGTLLSDQSPVTKLYEWISSNDDSFLLGVWMERFSVDYALDMLAARSDYLEPQRFKSFDLIRALDRSGDNADKAARDLAIANALLDGLDTSERMVEVHAKLTRLGKWDGTPVEVAVPMRLNHICAVALGIENPAAYDYDVEVAQDASVSDAMVFAEFEGLLLWMRPTRTPRGDLILELCAGASQTANPRHVLDLGSFDLEQSTQDQLYSRQRLTFRAGQPGAWKVVIGDTSSSRSTAGALRLELSVVH